MKFIFVKKSLTVFFLLNFFLGYASIKADEIKNSKLYHAIATAYIWETMEVKNFTFRDGVKKNYALDSAILLCRNKLNLDLGRECKIEHLIIENTKTEKRVTLNNNDKSIITYNKKIRNLTTNQISSRIKQKNIKLVNKPKKTNINNLKKIFIKKEENSEKIEKIQSVNNNLTKKKLKRFFEKEKKRTIEEFKVPISQKD